MAENEMTFREYNERVQKGFSKLERLAQQEGKKHLEYRDDMPLHFYCECSNEKCDKRIMLSPSVYGDIHQHRRRFIVIKGHNVPEVESIVSEEVGYDVVEKLSKLPASVSGLHDTGKDKE